MVYSTKYIPISLSLLHTIFQIISFSSSSLCLSGAVALLAKFCLDRFCHSLIVRQQFCSSPLQNQISSTTKGFIHKRRRYLKGGKWARSQHFLNICRLIIKVKMLTKWWWGLTKTSLKIFKHYMLKPSFSIIKDDKAKDRAGVGVGDKPPPPNYGRSINPNLTQFLYFI